MAMTPEVKAAVDKVLAAWGTNVKGSGQRVIRDFTDVADSVPEDVSKASDQERLGYAMKVLEGFEKASPYFSKNAFRSWESAVLPFSNAYPPAAKIYSEWKSDSDSYITDEGTLYQPPPDYNRWAEIAPQLGFQGEMFGVGVDSEGGQMQGGPTPEFAAFVDQKRAEGYDFVSKRSNQANYNNQTGFRLPSGEIVAQRTYGDDDDIKSFFTQFVLPAAGAAFTMGGGLNALAGGGAGAANALTPAAIEAGLGTAGYGFNASAAAASNAFVPSAIGAGAAIPFAGPLSGIEALAGVPVDPAFAAGMGVNAGMAALTPEVLTNISAGVGAGAAGAAATAAPAALPPLTPATTAARAVTSAAGANTGVPYLDKAIDFITTPAGAALVMGAGNIVGGVLGANAAENAAEIQAGAADRATALAEKMYQDYLDMNKPYYEAGVNALGKLTRGEILPEPGYAFRLGEGMKALERVQAARGNMLSGGALKAGQRYAQDLASQEYDNAYNRLANMAGLGQTATANAGTAGQNYASQAGELGLQSANALAQARVGRASSYGNALLGAAGALQDYAQAPMKEQMFRDIYGRLMGKP